MSAGRVVITGIGVVSSIGPTRPAFWESCLSGRSGAVSLDNPWVVNTDIATQFAAPIRGFDTVDFGIPAREVSILDRTTWFALAAGHEALADAGFPLPPRSDVPGRFSVAGADPSRLPLVVGARVGGVSRL